MVSVIPAEAGIQVSHLAKVSVIPAEAGIQVSHLAKA